MNIHEVSSQGNARTLDNVTIEGDWGVKGNGQNQNRFILVKDNTVDRAIALKIWGAAATGNYKKGDVISVVGQGRDGGVEMVTKDNKNTINANDCEVTIVSSAPAETGGNTGGSNAPRSNYQNRGGSSAPPRQNYSQPRNNPPAQQKGGESLTGEQIIDRVTYLMGYKRDRLLELGYSQDNAEKGSFNAGIDASNWWFGDRFC